MADCFEGLIGVSADFGEKPGGTFHLSSSGLYMDRLEGLNMQLMSSATTQQWNGEAAKAIESQIKEAARHLRQDVFKGITLHYKPRNEPYYGLIGDNKYTKSFSQNSPAVSWKLRTKGLEPSVIEVKKIGLFLDTTTTVEVTITKTGYILGQYQSVPEIIGTYSVNAIANKASYFDIPANNPLMLEVDGNEYEFSYTLPNGVTARDIKLSCTCSSRHRALKGYIENTIGESTKGITLDVAIGCDAMDIVCLNMRDDFDLKMAAAFALRYKTGELLLAAKKVNPDVNRFVLLNDEQMQEFMSLYLERYEENKNYLAQQLKMHKNSCYICDSASSMQRVGILI